LNENAQNKKSRHIVPTCCCLAHNSPYCVHNSCSLACIIITKHIFYIDSSHLISGNWTLSSLVNPNVTHLSNMLRNTNQTQQNSLSFNLYSILYNSQCLPSKPNHLITPYFIISLIKINKNHYLHDPTLIYNTINSQYHKCIISFFLLSL
jgi:hypothetical protein